MNFCKLSSHCSRKVCDRGTWNLVCKEYPYGWIIAKKISSSSVAQYRRKMRFSKTVWPRNMKFGLHRVSIWVNIRTIVQLWIFASYPRIFLAQCATEEHEICVCKDYPYWLIYNKNFKFLGCTLSAKCTTAELLQIIIAFFSKSVRPRNMKFGLQRVSIWVNIQKKFQVPRSHSIGEKCDANF